MRLARQVMPTHLFDFTRWTLTPANRSHQSVKGAVYQPRYQCSVELDAVRAARPVREGLGEVNLWQPTRE